MKEKTTEELILTALLMIFEADYRCTKYARGIIPLMLPRKKAIQVRAELERRLGAINP